MIAGKASTRRNEVISVIQLNSGRRMNFRPGALRLMIVTMKFSAATIDEMPRTASPRIQKSTRAPGEYCVDVRLA